MREDLSTSALGTTESSPVRFSTHGEEIVAVSPVFDDVCKVLLALAGAFPPLTRPGSYERRIVPVDLSSRHSMRSR